MWREYFPNARIVGFDIADFSKVPVIPGVRIMRGDLGDVDVLRRLIAVGPRTRVLRHLEQRLGAKILE